MLAPVTAQRILRGVAATITVSLLDQDGEPTSVSGALTVDVTAADGTVVATAGATVTDGGDPPIYSYSLAAQSQLGLLTFVWKDGGVARITTQVDVVGGFFFTVAEARAFDTAITTDLANDAKVQAVRREVEDECEYITGAAWVPRYARERYNAQWGQSSLLLENWAPRTIRSVWAYDDATTYTAFTTAELAALTVTEYGLLQRRDGNVWSPCNPRGWEIEYEYGYDAPPPDLKHACLTRLRSRLYMENTGIPDRAISFVPAEGGNFTIATPGRSGFDTGIPDVDAVYQRYSVKIPIS